MIKHILRFESVRHYKTWSMALKLSPKIEEHRAAVWMVLFVAHSTYIFTHNLIWIYSAY